VAPLRRRPTPDESCSCTRGTVHTVTNVSSAPPIIITNHHRRPASWVSQERVTVHACLQKDMTFVVDCLSRCPPHWISGLLGLTDNPVSPVQLTLAHSHDFCVAGPCSGPSCQPSTAHATLGARRRVVGLAILCNLWGLALWAPCWGDLQRDGEVHWCFFFWRSDLCGVEGPSNGFCGRTHLALRLHPAGE
jgi:hypothetical protein